MNTPLLWYVNRGTGMVLLLVLTVTTLLGVVATRGDAGRGLPRFVTQSIHRNLSLLSVGLLAAHVASAVLDEYVDIRWWQAVMPFGATYKPLYLALGTFALDLLAVVVLTSLLRHRLRHRPWRLVHLSAYAAWGLSVVHGFGIGTDSSSDFLGWLTIGCVATVAGGATFRGLTVVLESRRAAEPERVPLDDPEAWEGHR